MFKMRSTKWMVVDWIKSRREKRVPAGSAKAEYDKLEQTSSQLFDKYVSENLDVFQSHLYRHLLDFTKDKARTDILANKEVGVFERQRREGT